MKPNQTNQTRQMYRPGERDINVLAHESDGDVNCSWSLLNIDGGPKKVTG